MIKKQFTLYLENRPGALGKVTTKLAAAKVNLDGISVAESTDVGLVQIVVSNAAATRKVLQDAGVPFTVQDVALVKLKNRAGELAKIMTRLAKAGINVNYIYATGCSCGPDCDCYAILSAPNLKKVEQIWNGK